MKTAGRQWKNEKTEKTEMRDWDLMQISGRKLRKEDSRRGKKDKANIRRILTAAALLGLYILLCTGCGLMQDE